ncbi:MAG: CHAD domain-containing protein [Magnetococcales bacterium]|nr:CHAD domain-containing protein [Magnetococcales bacterium]
MVAKPLGIHSVKEGLVVPLSPQLGVGEAFGRIVGHELKQLQTWIPIAHDNSDVEGIHQARVSLRRMRSAVGVFAKSMPLDSLKPWSDTMRWLATALGPARDMDVFLEESLRPVLGKTSFRTGETVLLELTQARRLALQAQVCATLESPRCQEFISGFDRWLAERTWFQQDIPATTRLKLTRGIGVFARETLEKRYGKLVLRGKDLTSLSSPELHELRIACKKMRYASDFFSSLLPENRLRLFLRNLKTIQGVLGLMNDVATLPSTLDSLLEEVTEVQVLRFAGVVLGWRAKGYEDQRLQLPRNWEEFLKSPLPWREKQGVLL